MGSEAAEPVPLRELSTKPPQHPQTPYTKGMNKTPDLNAIMADYTQQVIAENRRRQAIRDAAAAAPQEWFAKWEATRPQGQWGRWHISDRH